MSAANSVNVRTEDLSHPHPICNEVFVQRGRLTSTIIYLSVAIVSLALGAIAFGYDVRERVSVQDEKLKQQERVLDNVEAMNSKLDILIRRAAADHPRSSGEQF